MCVNILHLIHANWILFYEILYSLELLAMYFLNFRTKSGINIDLKIINMFFYRFSSKIIC